jgi:hypothetical protein
VFCADGPAVLRLVARETGTIVRSQILEKGTLAGLRWAAGLECLNDAGGVRVSFQPVDNWWSALAAAVAVLEKTAHVLRVGNLAL